MRRSHNEIIVLMLVLVRWKIEIVALPLGSGGSYLHGTIDPPTSMVVVIILVVVICCGISKLALHTHWIPHAAVMHVLGILTKALSVSYPFKQKLLQESSPWYCMRRWEINNAEKKGIFMWVCTLFHSKHE